jgi:hypothetical protein
VSIIQSLPLLADAEWIKVVFGVVVFILDGLGHIISAREDSKKKKAKPQRPVPRPEQGPRADAPAAPPNQADPLRAEVEEFLRRAQGKPAAPAAETITLEADDAEGQRRAQRKPKKAPSLGESRQRPRQPTSRPPREQPRAPLAPLAPPINLRDESVAGHVARHVSTEGIAEQTSHLGEEVSQADEQMEAHLEEAFSGQLGSLKHREQVVAEDGPSIAEEIHDLISQPAGMRQMIVANEILRRPIDSW